MIKISNVSKRYGKTEALKNVSFRISEGQILAIIGPNGSGKSTLIKILSGLLKSYEGEVSFESDELSKVSLASEEFGFPSYYTVGMTIKLFSVAKNEELQKSNEIIDLLNLQELLRKKVGSLSQGQKQRLNIACTLIGASKMVIFDEPNNGLDHDGFMLLRRIVKDLKQRGHTIIIASHLLQELENLADDLVFIKDGVVVLVESSDQVLKEYGSFENAYLTHFST